MSYPINKVVVLGATGMLGLPVTRALAQGGFAVTAALRKPEAARALLPAGIRAINADVASESSLAAAFAGADAVYVSLSMTPAQTAKDFRLESDGMRAIVSAARAAGVSRVAYLSSIMQKNSAMDWWVLQMKREAVAILQRSGLDHTIFYPANFMESLPGRMRQGKRLAVAGRPRETSYWIAAEDYAAQVVAALRRAEAGVAQEYTIQGPEKFRVDEAARIFMDNYASERLSVARAPLALFKLLGLFSPTMDYVRHISEALNTTPEPFAADQTWAELGRPHTTLAQFAGRFQPQPGGAPA